MTLGRSPSQFICWTCTFAAVKQGDAGARYENTTPWVADLADAKSAEEHAINNEDHVVVALLRYRP